MVRISRSRMNMEDGRIDRPILKDHAEIAVGSSSTVFTGVGGTYTIDMTSGNTYNLILNANCSFTFSNPTGSGNACSFTLILKQDIIGRRTVTWPAAVAWQSAVAPTLTKAPGDYDIFSFTTLDGGTRWFGSQGERDHLNGVGTLWSWGSGSAGQLGHNDALSRSSPTQVGAFTNWAQSSVGRALKTDGTLWSWGLGTNGRLGHNDALNRSSPTQVGALTTWAQIAEGSGHTVALKTDGTLWSWGGGLDGPLGHSDILNRSSPTQIGNLTTWAQVAAGATFSLAVKTNGTLWSWGSRNGGLGLNDLTFRSSPTQIGALTDWAQVTTSGGSQHSLAIKTDGTLWSWGFSGTTGKLGHNNTTAASSPTQIGSLNTWAQIATGTDHSLAIKTDGTLWSWGSGTTGQLGHNDALSRSSPTQVGALTTWSQIAGGFSHTVALKTDGTLWSWGSGSSTGHGDIIDRSSPTQVGSLTTWAKIAGGTSLHFPAEGIMWNDITKPRGQRPRGFVFFSYLLYSIPVNIKGVAFDLEGTCVDLEIFHFTAYSETLADFGITMSSKEILSLPGAIGGGSRFVAAEVQKIYPDVDLSNFSTLKKERYEKMMYAADIIAREGLIEVLELLKSLSVPITLGSRTSRSQGDHLLTQSGLDAYFNKTNTVFAEDVLHNKPAPDVYLKTTEIMGVNPSSQLVFEDSAIGIESGVSAGSLVIAIPSPLRITDSYLTLLKEAGAIKIIRSWDEVTADFLYSI